MPRTAHGTIQTTDQIGAAHAQLVQAATATPLAFATVAPGEVTAFDLLFPGLQSDPDNLLPETPDTPAKLKALGPAMEDPLGATPDPADSDIPSLYTYFGQCVDHDISFEVQPGDLPPTRSASLADLRPQPGCGR